MMMREVYNASSPIHQSRYSVVQVQLGQLIRQVGRINLADITLTPFSARTIRT